MLGEPPAAIPLILLLVNPNSALCDVRSPKFCEFPNDENVKNSIVLVLAGMKDPATESPRVRLEPAVFALIPVSKSPKSCELPRVEIVT